MSQALSRHRLFVVVDKHITAWRIEELLRGQGYHARLGLEQIQPLHAEVLESPDPVHPDVMVLISGGQEVAAQVRERFPQSSVLMLNGRQDSSDRNALHTKDGPIRFTELLRRIQDVA